MDLGRFTIAKAILVGLAVLFVGYLIFSVLLSMGLFAFGLVVEP